MLCHTEPVEVDKDGTQIPDHQQPSFKIFRN